MITSNWLAPSRPASLRTMSAWPLPRKCPFWKGCIVILVARLDNDPERLSDPQRVDQSAIHAVLRNDLERDRSRKFFVGSSFLRI